MSTRRGDCAVLSANFLTAMLLLGCSGGSGAEGPGDQSATGGSQGGENGDAPGTGGFGATGGEANDGTGGAGEQNTGGQANGGQADGSGGGDPGVSGTPVEQSLPELLAVRQEHPVVALNGEIYVIGGFIHQGQAQLTASVDAYNPSTQAWRSVADFPYPVHHANAGVVDGVLYVTGFYIGSIANAEASPEVYAYDPGENTWTERTPMPAGTERASACTAVLGSRIYLFGGARSTTVDDASAYDAELDEWVPLPPLPEPREHCIAAAVNGTLYIVAGRQGGIAGVSDKTFAFDPVEATYREVAPIPTPRGGIAGAALGGRIYIFGGEGNTQAANGMFEQIEAYDPAADEWHTLPPMEVPRHGFGAATLDNRIFLAGGATTQGYGPTAELSVFFYE